MERTSAAWPGRTLIARSSPQRSVREIAAARLPEHFCRGWEAGSERKGQDRMGPWHNAKGAQIAKDVSQLHGDSAEEARAGNLITRNNALNEKGDRMNGLGDNTNMHDVLNGSQTNGRAYGDAARP